MPVLSTKTPPGAFNAALEASALSPENAADPVPAKVVILSRAALIRRMRLLPVSAIKSVPKVSDQTAEGRFKSAAVGTPPSP